MSLAAGRDAPADPGLPVSRRTRRFVHAFLLVFAITGIAHIEVFPFSGFRLFSEVRGRERTSWELRAVDADGVELPILLDELPLGYRQSWRLIGDMTDMSPSDRDEICDAWARPMRERGIEVTAVRVYRRVDDVRPQGKPSVRTLSFTCGDRAG